MGFKPLGLRVLVERVEEENKTASGIIIPDNAKEKPLQAKVIAVSKEVEEDEYNSIKVDDVVVFAKYAGSELSLDGKEYLVLNTDDILGIIS
jgi:chaperonin GroES